MKKKICIILSAAIIFSLLCGCGTVTDDSKAESDRSAVQTVSSAREFTDSLGRTVALPERLSRVAVSGPLSQIYVFPLCPELLVGFSSSFSTSAEKYIQAEYLSLPELGQLYGGKGTMNLEALLAADPEVIIDLGEAKDGMAEDLDKLTGQIGIPFVHIDAAVITAPEAYRKLGELLGDSIKAEQLAAWCEKTMDAVEETLSKVDSKGARKQVVYCLGDKGLNVLANGSFHAQIVSMVAENAAVLENPVGHGDGNEIDMEQLLLWDPDVILFQHNSIWNEVGSDPAWQELGAIASGSYYRIPSGPYGWISSPPAVQCYLGLLWLTDTLYPEYTDYDLKTEVTEYYRLFYGYDLSEADYEELIG